MYWQLKSLYSGFTVHICDRDVFDALYGCIKSSDQNALSCQISSFSSALPPRLCLSLFCRRQRSPPYGLWRVLWQSFFTAAPPMTARERSVSICLAHTLAFTLLSLPDLQSHRLCCTNLNTQSLVHIIRRLIFSSEMKAYWNVNVITYIHFNDACLVFDKLWGVMC